jgi:hypothetical protein
MRLTTRFSICLVPLMLLSTLGNAQDRPIELGLDAGVDFKVNDPNATTIGVPAQDVRFGFAIADRFSIEPRVSFNYLKYEGADAVWMMGLGAGLLLHMNEVRHGAYVRPFVQWTNIDVGSNSASQFAAGGGVGIKTGTGKVIGRFEVAYSHAFENDDFLSSDDVVLLLGFSVFTK